MYKNLFLNNMWFHMLVLSDIVYEVNDDLFPVSAFPRGFEFASAFFITECIR